MSPSTESALPFEAGRLVPLVTRRCALVLATVATGTAVCVSILAGWQRGGWLSERLLWVAIDAVLVVSAHLLPALCKSASLAVRGVGGALWVVCMVATCYGHATFFLMAQQHAGEIRAATVTAPASIVTTGRSLTQIADQRAATVAELATVTAQRCLGGCLAARVKRATLTARLEALDVEVTETQRQEATADRLTVQQDRATELRDSMRADPVTSRVAAFVGIAAARIDLLSGLAFAAVLESVACLLWFVVLQARDPMTVSAVAPPQTVPVAVSNEVVTTGHTPAVELVTLQQDGHESEVTRLAGEIAAGRVRATVSDIRRYLGCSQAKATALRRQFNESVATQ
ncbi:hypothetical protein [Paraburkholderia saeva]|uniref:hypothetical protein n=1 Tax=Paraburkholderia saeva TaxID=2777537 RepID=UPI001D6E9815|nr:hypothetical protein [Paraburkholderia saeva]CAG4911605.1 hypothetical protein R52603_03943 [Paraburkholderia saeva]